MCLFYWFSTKNDFAMSGDIFGCHNLGNATGDSAQHSIMHKTVSTTKNYPTSNVNSAKVEKSSSLPNNCIGFKESTLK